MKLHELNELQKHNLRQLVLCEDYYDQPSYYELANADLFVSDETLEEKFGDIEFTEEDFM